MSENIRPIRVVVAEDHPIMREGTQALLARSAGIEVVGTVDSGLEALRLIAAVGPDVVILDVRLPDMSGVEVARQMRKIFPEVAILVLTGYDDISYIQALLPLGVQGYLRKTATGEEIVAGVRAVARGQMALTSDLLKIGFGKEGIQLTEREREVLVQLAAGQRNKEIAETIGVSIKTVEFHVGRILAKLGARSRTEAISSALQQGLVSIDTLIAS